MPQLVERDAVAKRQDLGNVIHVADKKKTPFWSMVKKGTQPTNTLQEWPVESYPAPTTAGAVDEKDVQEWENLSGPDAVLKGRIQIWERKPKVSRLAQMVNNQAGVGNRKAFAKAVAKGMVMIVRDIETTALGDNESQVGTATKAYQTRGLGRWIQTGAQTDLPVDENYRPLAGAVLAPAIGAVVDDTITGVMQTIYDETGDDEAMMMGFAGSLMKRRLSRSTMYGKDEVGYTFLRRYNAKADEAITLKVDVLDTDFGRVVLRNSSFINTGGDPTSDASKRLLYLLNMETISMRFAENPNSRDMPDGGGGPRALIEAIGCLEVGNPLFLGKIAATA